MKGHQLTNFNDTYMVIFGMFIFLSVFSMVSWQALRSSMKKHYEQMAQLPLNQENLNEQR